VWNPYEQSAVVTVLHPALLEMLQAQILYLLSSFSAVASNALKQPARTSFRESVWQNYLDLSAIQMPLMGLIVNPDKILSTNISGQDLIHRIGEKSKAEASLTTRLLLRYDAFEEEDITDAELFRISRESSLLLNIIHDYKKLHPHAQDGLTIAVYQNHDIQPLIAAVNQFLKETQINRDEHLRKYVITITVFTESSDDTSLSRWIAQWQERWENAESQESMRHYRRCHLSIAHRIVSPENYYRQFRQLLSDGFNADIIFLNNFIEARGKGNDFQTVEQYDVTTRTLKFPITEKSFCAFRDYHLQPIRTRILSNRQFRLSTQHAELMARLKNNVPQNANHVVLGYGDYTPWHRVVDDLHERAEWVVCIDPNIDEKLIRFKGTDGVKPREIIGFGSGVGAYGESNYTISTEQFQLSDILNRLKAAISDIYQGWDSTIFEDVASSVLKESQKLSGLSLVRATGIGQNIRDFMAYALTRKLVSDKDCKLCDHLVSLDAYRHWFESADSDTRPDLLWLCASIDKDGYLNLHLRLIECKLAQQSDEHISKARQQIESGLKHLITVFMPKRKDDVIEDFRPDQRYWWLQLHRLIASKAEIEGQDQARALMALERLSEGEFRIKWTAAVLTFWTDSDSSEIKINDEWEYQYEDNVLTINVLAAGKTLVKHLCESNDEKSIEVPWDNEGITFDGVEKIKQKVQEEPEEVETENTEEQATIEPVPGVLATSNEKKTTEEQESYAVRKKEVPDRVFLGKTSSGGKSVYWEYGHKDLSNRHMLLFGTSGMGKTYAIQCLLCELGFKNLNSLIIDYTSGFFDNQLEGEFVSLLNPYQHIVRKRPIAINPFRQQSDIIGDELVPEHEGNTAQRITSVFGEVYRLGDQQKSALYQAIKQGLSTQGTKGMTMSDLIPYLEELAEEKGTSGTSASSVISKIRPFIDQNPFGEEDPESWERLFNDLEHKSHVLQLAGFLRDGARLITEFSLIDLYWFYRASGSKNLPRVVVLDEVQNLDHREESPLAQLLREGRKFGFSLILATQIMSDLEKDERDRLFNAAHKLFFRPADTEIKTYAEIAANTTNEKVDTWVKRLASFGKTECYSLGPSLNEATGNLEIKAYKIKIASLAERNIHG
jgi:DNA phosphorothioation-dependent restriction protein DptH